MTDTINTINFLYNALTCGRNISNDVFRFSPLIVANHHVNTIPQHVKELTELIGSMEAYILKSIDILQIAQPVTIGYHYVPDTRFSSNNIVTVNKMLTHHISTVTMLSFNIHNYQNVLNGYGLFATIMCNKKSVDCSENNHNNTTMLHMTFQLIYTYLSYLRLESDEGANDCVFGTSSINLEGMINSNSQSNIPNPTNMGIITASFAEDKSDCPICLDTYDHLNFVWSTSCPHPLCRVCTINLYKKNGTVQRNVNCPVCRRERLSTSLYSLAKITKYQLQNYTF